MGLRDEFDAVTDVVAPELGFAKIAVKIGLAFLALAIVAFAFWWIFLKDGQARQRHDLATARAGQLLGQANGSAGAHAANTIAKQSGDEAKVHEITRDHYVEITKQPGAGDQVSDAVDSAFRRAVCLRASAASLPDCQRLQEANP